MRAYSLQSESGLVSCVGPLALTSAITNAQKSNVIRLNVQEGDGELFRSKESRQG